MTRVGFWFDYGLVYAGGLNYFRNLLHALHQVRHEDVHPLLFTGKALPSERAQEFSATADLVPLDMLTRGTSEWFVHRCLYRSVRSQLMVERVLRRHRVDVVSHASMVERLSPAYKLISWVPDFQYLHLPQLFPGLDPDRRSRHIAALHRQSDALVVSSGDALADLQRVLRTTRPERTHVLPFASQIRGLDSAPDVPALLKKYGLTPRFFMLPNQFWAHKNHTVVFEAVRRLKERGLPVSVVCTGWINDPRSRAALAEPLRLHKTAGLEDCVKLLGVIDYADVLTLMRASIAVLNPSFFEGWSSSVEEAKSMGKPVIVSDIAVHREQAHPKAHYFDPRDPEALARLLAEAWKHWPEGIDPASEAAALHELKARTREFGQRYLDVVRAVVDGGRTQ